MILMMMMILIIVITVIIIIIELCSSGVSDLIVTCRSIPNCRTITTATSLCRDDGGDDDVDGDVPYQCPKKGSTMPKMSQKWEHNAQNALLQWTFSEFKPF